MNPQIAQLAREPHGKPYQSRLLPYSDEIRGWRDEHVAYRTIAARLAERGCVVSHAAVHDFVRVRDASRSHRQYAMTPPMVETFTRSVNSWQAATQSATSEVKSAVTEPGAAAPKKFIHHDQPVRKSALSDEQLQINDPLARSQPTKQESHVPT